MLLYTVVVAIVFVIGFSVIANVAKGDPYTNKNGVVCSTDGVMVYLPQLNVASEVIIELAKQGADYCADKKDAPCLKSMEYVGPAKYAVDCQEPLLIKVETNDTDA